ncbi:MAG TPA: serine hydrolase domain-containing protein [Herbaspirillum sp.]|uniref:serine hydrolase domain-containing protein n=1 Tax=Herbaspirillum sp. TaxID=1890675 RepID=UPI002D25AC85|nr:serine hydrolase domain-containing protein [Herbaspirillum sp.]HZG18805.1 serine hydrolase domain-containing protein [Herbaspirillum sp.]
MFRHPLKKTVLTSLWGIVAALTNGCASVHDGRTSAQVVSPRDVLQQNASRYDVCATAALIKHRQLLSVETAQGCASASLLTPDSVFEAASLSKPVFAYAVLKLVQDGTLDLDAPVLNYLPDGYLHQAQPYKQNSKTDEVSDPRIQSITVRMALNHTSGLPNWAGGPLTFEGEPGERWRYSGEAYVLLQRAVEAVTHERLDEFMERQVFRPLGMKNSAFIRQSRLEKHIVAGSTSDGTVMRPFPFRVPVAAFTLYTSAKDYGLFLAALLNDERTLEQIVESPVTVNPKLELGWGLGWGLERKPDDILIWHWGNNPGYRAFVMASTTSGDGYVMLTNSDAGLALAQPLADAVLPQGPHKAFRFHLLREGLSNLLCETFDVCL